MAYFHTTVLDNQIKALPTVSTASGSVASFDTDMVKRLVSLVAEISASASKAYIVNMSDLTNKSYFEGLINGTYGFIDLGSVTYTKNTVLAGFDRYVLNVADIKNYTSSAVADILIKDWEVMSVVSANSAGRNDVVASFNKSIYFYTFTGGYTDATAFKNAMSGKYLIYEYDTTYTPNITANEFDTLLAYFDVSGWCYEYNFGETVSSGATLDCISGILTRSDDSTKSVGGNIITALSDNNIFASTGNVTVKYILSVGKAIS